MALFDEFPALAELQAGHLPAPDRESALATPRTGEPARLAPIQLRPIELASEGLIALWREAARTDLVTVLLPQAIRTLGVIIRDTTASPAARVSACKTVLEHALRDPADLRVKKALHEMSAAEIEEALVAIREEIDQREPAKGRKLALPPIDPARAP